MQLKQYANVANVTYVQYGLDVFPSQNSSVNRASISTNEISKIADSKEPKSKFNLVEVTLNHFV